MSLLTVHRTDPLKAHQNLDRIASALDAPGEFVTEPNVRRPDFTPGITAIVPAYNEAASITATVHSLQRQSVAVTEIIVVDDFSTDGTGDIARELGAKVVRPPQNTGSKAGAQTFALPFVRTEFCMAIDADTQLAPDAVEKIMAAMQDETVAAACGSVLPRYVRTVWERGRYIEYMFAFTFFKQIQDFFGKPMISSGCFSAYRTDILRNVGGWSNRTMAEDMDLTWSLYTAGHAVRFVSDAVCYPIEPHNYHYLSKQLRRWSHGFVQNVRLHWRPVMNLPYLRMALAVQLWDASIAAAAYLVLFPLLALFVHPLFLLGYVIDLPAVAVPVMAAGIKRGELARVIVSLPCFIVMRFVNAIFMLRALWSELVIGRTLLVYEKGH
jgi:cellulose synthase/poly-beta-1,6-N-acetylglucosamine synthase-like glycosyltransferase